MPQVRHRSHSATATTVSSEEAKRLLATGEYVRVDVPRRGKGDTVAPSDERRAREAAVADSGKPTEET